jgi:hypothetical protein
MKHAPFDSIYRQDFEVLEERRGDVVRYPHTEQLPLLLRALNLEFNGALPGHISRTDRRGDGFHKILLKSAALMFCNVMNAARTDKLRLYPLPDPDLVARVAIVQQIRAKIQKVSSMVNNLRNGWPPLFRKQKNQATIALH